MANNYISIKVCGNPNSNSGFSPLLLFNNPSFVIKDQFYVGLDNCSYFFSIKVEQNQTVYKLIKNNVRSFRAVRDGSLVIAFSIPKGYVIDGGYTPYDVLIKLKNEFLKQCMTCKDATRETYEFNPGIIDQHILDETAKGFTISPAKIPHRVMNPNGGVGYVMRPEEEIEKLFHDTLYPEFQKYEEVILAEDVNTSNYLPIQGIQIPRPKVYSLIHNGILQPKRYADVTEKIAITSGKEDDPCFEHRKEIFCIQDLIDGNFIDGITLDCVEEQIVVNTEQWIRPKTVSPVIRVSPQEYENDVLMVSRLIKIDSPRGEISHSGGKFSLKGEDIRWILDKKLQVSLKPNIKYELVSSSISDSIISVKVQKVRPISTATTKRSDHTATQQQQTQTVAKMPVVDVKLSFSNGLIEEIGKNPTIEAIRYDGTTQATLLSSKVYFRPTKNGYEGHIYIPKEFLPEIHAFYFKNKEKEYKVVVSLNSTKELFEYNDMDVKREEKSFFYRYLKVTLASICGILLFSLGAIVGDYTDPIVKYFNGEDIQTKKEKREEERRRLEEEERRTEERKQQKEALLAQLKDIDENLNEEGLTFKQVDDFYSNLSGVDPDLLKEVVKSSKEPETICKRIKAYKSVKDALLQGDYNEVTKCMNKSKDFVQKHISYLNVISDKTNFEKFKQDMSTVKSFEDLNNFSSQSTTYKCKKYECRNEVFYSQKELNDHKDEKRHWECTICKDTNGWCSWFGSKDELEGHMNTKHNER